MMKLIVTSADVLKIYDMKDILQNSNQGNSIDISQLNSGIYLMKIQSNNKINTVTYTNR